VKLYSYFRSSAAYRLRIALNLKGLDYDYVAINLLKQEQKSEHFRAINPAALVPALETDDGAVLTQSVAILEWLEDVHPEPALVPVDTHARAVMRSVVNHIACDIHPLCNSGVTTYLRDRFDADDEQISHWYTTWMHRGFTAVEALIRDHGGAFCVGDRLTLADVCLVPQVYNARRFSIALDAFPGVRQISERCLDIAAFDRAAPERQPDAPE
jgi:maleylacetoacetate isomerase